MTATLVRRPRRRSDPAACQLEALLQPGGQLDVHMDPDAKLDLQLTLDGLPLAKEQLLLGPYSLPLLSQGTADRCAGCSGS
ncbi:MAG: hypothetical protein U0787_07055 [Polyangia bacterium]